MERHLLNGLLTIAALSTESALLLFNRWILSAGTYKFPFPVTTTLIQSVISFIVVVSAGWLTTLLLSFLAPAKSIISLDGDQEHLLHEDEKLRPRSTVVSRRRSPLRKTALSQCFRHAFWRIIAVVFLYYTKNVLGNTILTRLPLITYTLLRVAAVPLSVTLNASLSNESHSTLAICCLTIATMSVILSMMPLLDIEMVQLLYGALLPLADALFPIVLVNAFDGRYQRGTSQKPGPEEDRKYFSSSTLLRDMQQECSNFWSILRQVSFLSTIVLAVHVLISGELQGMKEDCYVLDADILRMFLAAGGALNGLLTIFTALLALAASPLTVTFLAAPMNAIQLAIFMYIGFNQYRWIGLSVCWAFALAFVLFPTNASSTNTTAGTRKLSFFARSIIVTLVLCGTLYGMNGLLQRGGPNPDGPTLNCQANSDAKADQSWSEALNETIVTRDDYLGARPHVDTIANMTFLVEQCREIEDGGGVDDVVNCLSILETAENEYFSVPKKTLNARISKPDSDNEQSLDFTRKGRSVGNGQGKSGSKSSFGTCDGPVIPFHVYWTGPATWRVELFIKAYLYTQNLPCSRLWLWLDSDLDANVIEKMLCDDPIFQRFRSLVSSGDILLKSWTFPNRVPLSHESTGETLTPNSHQETVTEDGEVILANGIIQDATGQQWLNFHSPHASLAPVQVSDAVRFIILHLHGGVYCDMDVLLLRDMRPLLLPDPVSGAPRAFAEQWVERCDPFDYNTAVISLPANSSLSSYLLRGGARMGMNFHPRVIGRMLWADGKGDEVAMMHNAVFDPLVTNLRREGTDTCTVPCHKNFKSAFMEVVEEHEKEWSNFRGNGAEMEGVGNRSLGNFFRGAWAYHIHNQWWKFPEPNSWMDVISRAQDGYFAGARTNAYGESWTGPAIRGYDRDGWP